MMQKPRKLQEGSRVAAISLSWGGPGLFPHRYEAGKRQFQEAFGVEVIETKHALKAPDWLARNPAARAGDLMSAFSDPEIHGVISTIGGEDSIRILPYLDLEVLRANPKIFMGYSDTTITHFVCRRAGLVSFYGPAFMAGFGENGGLLPYMVDSVRRTLFTAEPIGMVEPNRDAWTVEHLGWANPENQQILRKRIPCTGWKFLQGEGVIEGRLLGGCIEVLDWLRGTDFWPPLSDWDGAILFLETSEEAPPPSFVARFIRCLAATGVLERLAGILVGRPGGEVPEENFANYDFALKQTVADEFGFENLPVVTRMDFGHTDPIFVLPQGVLAKIDCDKQIFSIEESAVA